MLEPLRTALPRLRLSLLGFAVCAALAPAAGPHPAAAGSGCPGAGPDEDGDPLFACLVSNTSTSETMPASLPYSIDLANTAEGDELTQTIEIGVVLRAETLTVTETLPAVMVGLTVKDFIADQFSAPPVVGCLLLVTGGIVWTTRSTRDTGNAQEPTWLGALLIGLAQAFAILPGISRSGSTVAAALALGVAPVAAAEFSFLLGIVAITGAAVLILPDLRHAEPEQLSAVGLGVSTALVSGVLAIRLFVRMLRTNTFHHFAWWAWLAGAGFLAWQLLD